MERYAWKATLKKGKKTEYIKRHKEIWAEMIDVLKLAGIKNYSIWLVGNDLFGYYECEKGKEYASRIQAESPVVNKWNEYMKDVMIWKKIKPQARNRCLKKFFIWNRKIKFNLRNYYSANETP